MKFSILARIFIACAFFSGLSLTIDGQVDETVRIETNLVSVNVAVLNERGEFVKGLKQDQFEIFDNDAKQEIAYFSAEESPVSYGIVYDMHPTTEERMTAVLNSLRSFTKELGKDDRFFIVAFNERGYLNLDFIPTGEQLRDNLKSAEPRSLYDAIYIAAESLRASRNPKRTLLIISDSSDHQSRHNFSDLSKIIKTFDVQIYAVIFDESQMWGYKDLTTGGVKQRRKNYDDASPLERAELEKLSMKSGGTANTPMTGSEQELYNLYRKIDSEMRQFYSLSFYPEETDDKLHKLRIGINRSVKGSKKFALTYRQNYQTILPKR